MSNGQDLEEVPIENKVLSEPSQMQPLLIEEGASSQQYNSISGSNSDEKHSTIAISKMLPT